MSSGRIRNPEDSNWPPSFKILRASTGAHSPRVDERCLTYCTQTVSGRTAGRLPTCRAICVRQVFMHELAKLSGQRPRSFTALTPLDKPAESPELDEIPLPTEGQRPGDFFAPLWPPFLLPKRKDDSTQEDRSGRPMSAADALRAAGKAVEVDERDDVDYNAPQQGKPPPPKTWQPGMYVWMTRSKWHALDHMNMMMFSIRAQAGWDNYRARMRTEAEKRRALEQAQSHKKQRTASAEVPPDAKPAKVVYEDVTRPKKDEFHPGMMGRKRGTGTALPSYPDVGGQSVLLSLPPPMPSLRPALETLISPLGRALDLSAKAWKDGSYSDFGQRFYNKSFGEEWREPWQLLGKAWEVMQKKSKGDDD